MNANSKNKKLIDNPILVLNDYIDLYSKLLNENVCGYVLLKKNCLFSVLNKESIKVIPLNAFYYHFSKLVKSKKYDQAKIDNLYEKIVNKWFWISVSLVLKRYEYNLESVTNDKKFINFPFLTN